MSRKSRKAHPAVADRRAAPYAQTFNGLDDPALAEFIRTGGNSRRAYETSSVVRCITLRSNAIGMLPLRLMHAGTIQEAKEHPLYNVLMYEPNAFQTAFEFKSLMETRVIAAGDGFARIVKSGKRVVALLPIDPDGASVEVAADGRLTYRFTQNGRHYELPQEDVFHLRGFSTDGVRGISMLRLAEDAIGLSREASRSLRNIYQNGMSAGGVLTHPNRLGDDAKGRLKQRLEEYSGSKAAGKFLVLDEGMAATAIQQTARDSQTIEAIRHTIEDVGRFFGVPRPLLGLEDTNWGSGVEQLAILFVRFGLAPSFTNWEQAIQRSLLTREEKRLYVADFDERELLRGSMKDQAEFFAKASGSGGHKPWMEANEIREMSGLPPHKDGAGLEAPGANRGTQNDAAQTA